MALVAAYWRSVDGSTVANTRFLFFYLIHTPHIKSAPNWLFVNVQVPAGIPGGDAVPRQEFGIIEHGRGCCSVNNRR